MSAVSLSELLGVTVRDASGQVRGRVRELAVTPQDHPTRIQFFIVRTPDGERMLPLEAVRVCVPSVRASSDAAAWDRYTSSDGVLLLKRDLLDQQIIDVHGRKVVRVNDVELDAAPTDNHLTIDVRSVDVGTRGAIRRIVQGMVPSFTLRALLEKIPPRVIPWEYVDLIEANAARRVKLKIAYRGLAQMHPADIADIVEDLPPAEQKGVFEALDHEVAADALAEIDPDIQVAIVESLDSDRAADIVEEMDPGAAADLLGELTEDRTGQILKEMDPEGREEVEQLLEFGEHTAAGRMTTDFIAVSDAGHVDDAIDALRTFEGGKQAMSTIYLTGSDEKLVGCIPLVKIALSSQGSELSGLSEPYMACAPDTPENRVLELFDKYNLTTLAVVDEHGRLSGIITSDDVIAILRHRK